MNPYRESLMKYMFRSIAILAIALSAVVPTLAQTSPPVIVSSVGYINGTPLTAHTSTAFNSSGASTLVAFVSTNTPWNGLPVSISGLSDNLGNSWNLLTGPTVFSGSSYTLQSAIYYVSGPATSTTHTVTAQLTNPAPLVLHVFAVSGSDVTGPPIFSAITDPGAGGTSANVTTAPITVPTDSLLLSWVKNETGATAAALNSYTLDTQSTSYLWAESQTPISAGSYTGAFQYDSAIGWQTAIVGIKPSTGPVAFSQSVVTDHDTPVDITLTATSPQGYQLTYSVLTLPTHGTLSGSAPNLTYTPNAGYIGPDAFTFVANDGVTNSNTATVSITVHGLAPYILSSVGYINPTPLTAHTSTAFNSTGASSLVAFVSSHPSWNGLPVSISGLSDNLGNSWSLLTGPTLFFGSSFTLESAIYYVNSPATSATHTITAQLTNPAPLVLHVFAVSGSDVTGPPIFSAITDPGAGGISANVTTAPIIVPINSLLLSWVKNETSATAFGLNGYTLDTQSTSYLWAESQTPNSSGSYAGAFQYDSAIGWQTALVGVKPHSTAPPTPVITAMPANPTNQTSASFTFTDTQAEVSFQCQLDASGFSACSSPATYSGLGEGSHTFAVEAQDSAGNLSGPASFTWAIDTSVPPTPVITSTPPNLTNQTSANFSFSDTEAGVSFLCQLDDSAFSACSSPTTYSSLSQGNHTFAVEAQDAAGNLSGPASFTWDIDTSLPTYSISGTISGAGGANAIVTLNGVSAATATADASGNYSFSGLLNGSYFVTVGNAGYVFTPASQDVVINNSNYTGLNFATVSGCPACDTIWLASAMPLLADGGDPAPNELGVKFRADNDGYITGLRFYKAVTNTGTHLAHLWTSTGTLLGSATFASESAVGWQQVLFAAPLPVVANTTYVASYFAPAGHYSGDSGFFATAGVDNPPLHALANGVDGPNGVYLATTTGGFPTATNQSSNYWVDVVYSNTQGYSIVGTISGPGGAGATVTLTGASTATTTADGSGNYSFNGLANGSYTVTPSSAGYVFTPSSQAVTISGAHAMNVNFTSAAQTNSISGTISGPGGPGATVNLAGASTATTTADGSGNYSFAGLANGSYMVTPSNGSYIFTPASQSTTISGASISGLNFNSLPTVSTVGVSPASVLGGSTSTGTVMLNGPAPAGGAVVSLSSSNTAAAQVQASVTVAANTTTATFPVNTSPVGVNTSLTISGTYGATQNASFTVTAPVLSSVSLNPTSVPAGASATGTVTLNGPAPSGGAVVTLSSSNIKAAQVLASVTVAANATTATFTVTTSSMASNTSLTISGTYGVTVAASFTVLSGVLNTVTLNPTSVVGGTSSTGTVTLTQAAPTGGAMVTLSSNNTAAAQVPASVTVAAGASSVTFAVTTTPVAANTSVTISGTYGRTRTGTLTVTAPRLTGNGLTVGPTSVIGGTSSTGTVKLTGPAPSGGAMVTLSSNNTAAAQVPPSVTVPAGATTATFTITTSPVSGNTSVTLTGFYGVTDTATLTVTAATLNSVTLSPTSLIGGTSSTGTVTLNGPAPSGGAVVTLSSSNTGAAQVLASVSVAANTTTATFTVTTSPVATNTSVRITATCGTARTATLTVTAPTLSALTLNPSTVRGPAPSTGTVTLSGPAPTGGTVVTLSSSLTSVARVPASVTVAAGGTSATFTVTTVTVTTSRSVTISGTKGVTRTSILTVTP